MKHPLSSLLAIALCSVLMAFATSQSYAQSRSVRVTGQNVRLRLGPSTSDAIFAFERIPIYPEKGEILPLLGESGDWYKVRFHGNELYIFKRFAEPTAAKASAADERILEYMNRELMPYGDQIAKPLQVIGIDLDNDNRDELLAHDQNNKIAIFGQRDSLTCIAWFNTADNVTFYPSKGAIRYYNGVSTGYEEEFYYILEGSRLMTQYRRQAQPLGDIKKQRSIRVKNTYTRVTFPGRVVVDITEEEFSRFASQFKGEEGQKFSDMYDL